MKLLEAEETLKGDSVASLTTTANEYLEDDGQPTLTKSHGLKKQALIQIVIDLMIKAGEIEQSDSTFKLPDLAREIGVNPKVARDRFRKSLEQPPSVKFTGWVFDSKYKELVRKIIAPKTVKPNA